MNILIFPEGFNENGVHGTMGQKPQFNLGIIRGDEDAAVCRDKGLPDLFPFGFANGNVLQIRVGR